MLTVLHKNLNIFSAEKQVFRPNLDCYFCKDMIICLTSVVVVGAI